MPAMERTLETRSTLLRKTLSGSPSPMTVGRRFRSRVSGVAQQRGRSETEEIALRGRSIASLCGLRVAGLTPVAPLRKDFFFFSFSFRSLHCSSSEDEVGASSKSSGRAGSSRVIVSSRASSSSLRALNVSVEPDPVGSTGLREERTKRKGGGWIVL